jgi:hypothetical protein
MSPQAGMDMVHRNVTGPLGQAIDQGLTTTGPAVSAYGQGYSQAAASQPQPVQSPSHGMKQVWVGQGTELPQPATISY